MVSPGGKIHVQSRVAHLVPTAFIYLSGKEVGHLPSPARQFVPRQPDVTLALVGPIVHCHQQPIPTRALPNKGQEAIPGPVAFPGGSTFEQLPLAMAHDRLPENGKQPVVKLL